MRKKKHLFLKIWLKVAVPLSMISIILMFLGLNLVLHVWMMLEYDRGLKIVDEQVSMLETREFDFSDRQPLESFVRLEQFDMAAILYDEKGNRLCGSDIKNYQQGKIPQEIFENMLKTLETYREQTSVAIEWDVFRYTYVYGYEQIHRADGNYELLYAYVLAPWKAYQHEYMSVGAFVVAMTLILTYVIAGSFYKMYCKEIKLEEYYIHTSNAIAHDLKTPLMAISGYSENLLEQIHTEKREYYAQSILDNARKMNDMIENMLQMTNRNPAYAALHKQELKMREITQSILKEYQDMIEKKDIRVQIQGEGVIHADLALMRRAVSNLISNAVKYTPAHEKIFVRISNRSFEIENTGVSIERKKLKDMWKPFVKADTARNEVNGTGIGLTIVKEILEAHHFRYKLESTENSVVVRICY